MKRQEICMRDEEIIVAPVERSLKELSASPDFNKNRSTRKLPTVGELREEMRSLTTIRVRELAEENLVDIDAFTAASKHLKGNYINQLRIA